MKIKHEAVGCIDVDDAVRWGFSTKDCSSVIVDDDLGFVAAFIDDTLAEIVRDMLRIRAAARGKLGDALPGDRARIERFLSGEDDV